MTIFGMLYSRQNFVGGIINTIVLLNDLSIWATNLNALRKIDFTNHLGVLYKLLWL